MIGAGQSSWFVSRWTTWQKRDEKIELLIRTQAESFRRTSMLLAQDIVRDDGSGTVIAQAKVTAVWIGPNRRPMRVPEEVREGLTQRGLTSAEYGLSS